MERSNRMPGPNHEPVAYALSLKQPWAALVVHGLKTVEVRNWPTARRGLILIHASRVADDRPEAWQGVLEGIRGATTLCGGIVGAAELTGCTPYRSREQFALDQGQHLNEPG